MDESMQEIERRLDKEALEIEIEELQKAVEQREKAIQDYAEAIKISGEIRRTARQLLKQICDHESTMAETEIMLKLVMNYIWEPDDVGDIPF